MKSPQTGAVRAGLAFNGCRACHLKTNRRLGGAHFQWIGQVGKPPQGPQTMSAPRHCDLQRGGRTEPTRPRSVGCWKWCGKIVHGSAVRSAPQRKLGVGCQIPSAKLSKGQKPLLGEGKRSRQTAPYHPSRKGSRPLALCASSLTPSGAENWGGRGPHA